MLRQADYLDDDFLDKFADLLTQNDKMPNYLTKQDVYTFLTTGSALAEILRKH